MNKLSQGFDDLFNCHTIDTSKHSSVDCEKAVRELLSRVAGMSTPTVYVISLVCSSLIEVRFSNGQEMGYKILIRDRDERSGALVAELFSSKQFNDTGKETVISLRFNQDGSIT
jgi:hypothetical protein